MRRVLAVLLFCMTLLSCSDDNIIFARIHSLEDKPWNSNKMIEQKTLITDTLSYYELTYFISSLDKDFVEIDIQTVIEFAGKQCVADTIKFGFESDTQSTYIAKERKQYYTAMDSIHFSKSGEYTFKFSTTQEVGILAFGVVFKKK